MRNLFLVLTICLTALVSVGSASRAHAVSQSIDLEKIDPEVAAQVLKELQKQKSSTPSVPTVTQAKEWASVGEDVAKAVAATAKALSMEVNDFIRTPVGRWVFLIMLWQFIGKTIFGIFLGLGVWAILATIIWNSFRTFHIPRQMPLKTPEGAVTGYETKTYQWNTKDAKVGSAWAHGIAFAVITIIMLVKVSF